MLWVPLHLAAAYACTYPFGKRDPDTIDNADTVGADTAFMTAIVNSAPGTITPDEFNARLTQCDYAAANTFARGATCHYHDASAKFFVGFENRCDLCGTDQVPDDYYTDKMAYPVQCTAADPGDDAYAIEYAPATTNKTSLAIRLDMPVMAETADFLEVMCRDQCSLHHACSAYLAINARTCLLIGDLTPGHMDQKTTTTATTPTTPTTTTTATTTTTTTATTTTTEANDICTKVCDDNPYSLDADKSCRYVKDGLVYCFYGRTENDCMFVDNVDMYHCKLTNVDNVFQLVATLVSGTPVTSTTTAPVTSRTTAATTTTPPHLQEFDAVKVAAGTAVQRRAIRHRRTDFSAPALRWAAIENYNFETLTKLQVDGELSILACAEKCQSIPECKSAFWGGIHEGCRYWSGDGHFPFDQLYWGTASGQETPLKVLPVVYTVQGVASAFNRWYDPFEEIEPCSADPCLGSMCADTDATHLRVRSTDADKENERFDVRIYNCPHLQELHWMHHARIVENSLTNCTSLREVVFAGSTTDETVDDNNDPECGVDLSFTLDDDDVVIRSFCNEPDVTSCTASSVSDGNCGLSGTSGAPGAFGTRATVCSASYTSADDATHKYHCCFHWRATFGNNPEYYAPECFLNREAAISYYGGLTDGVAISCSSAEPVLVTTPPAPFGVTTMTFDIFGVDCSPAGGDNKFVKQEAGYPTTSCAFYPLLYVDGTTVKAMVDRTLTAFPTQDQYPDVDATADGLTLDLGVHHMAEVHENAAESCPYGGRVAVVKADHNIITTVGPGAFSAFTALEFLDLSHNMITSISDTALTGCTKISTLILNTNMISSLSQALVANFSASLITLRVQDNLIEEIQAPTTITDLQTDTAVVNCNGDTVECEHCDHSVFLACGTLQAAEFPTDIVERALGLEVDTTQLPVPANAYPGRHTMTAYCIPCDADPLAELGPHGRGFLGEAIRGVTLSFYAECPHLRHAHTVNVGYEVAVDEDVEWHELEKTVNYLPKSPQLESFTTSRNLDNRHELLGYRGAPETTLSATTYRLTPCDARVLGVTGSQAAMAAAFVGCLSRELHVVGIRARATTSVGAFTFASMLNLRRVRMPDSLVAIAPTAFQGSESITDLLIPAGAHTSVNSALNVLGRRGCPEPNGGECAGPLCAGDRADDGLYGICGCTRDVAGCFEAEGDYPALQVADATSPACGPEPVSAMGPLYKAHPSPLLHLFGTVPVDVTAKGATEPITMLAPVGRLHELCTGAGARGLAAVPPPPAPPGGLGVVVDNTAPQLPAEMSRAAVDPDELPAYAVALVAIGGVGVVLGAAKLLRIV
jgi:hypothetical protein